MGAKMMPQRNYLSFLHNNIYFYPSLIACLLGVLAKVTRYSITLHSNPKRPCCCHCLGWKVKGQGVEHRVRPQGPGALRRPEDSTTFLRRNSVKRQQVHADVGKELPARQTQAYSRCCLFKFSSDWALHPRGETDASFKLQSRMRGHHALPRPPQPRTAPGEGYVRGPSMPKACSSQGIVYLGSDGPWSAGQLPVQMFSCWTDLSPGPTQARASACSATSQPKKPSRFSRMCQELRTEAACDTRQKHLVTWRLGVEGDTSFRGSQTAV